MEEWKRKFYNSKQWKQVRAIAMNKAKGLCNRCGKLVIGKHSVHHITKLTKDNYTDPSISLNIELLELLCEPCHNREHNKLHTDSFINKYSNKINFDARESKLNTPPYK